MQERSITYGQSVNGLAALRRDLTNRRNREPDQAEREWLTLLINNMDGLIRDPADSALRTQFAKNVRAYERRRAGGVAHV